MAKYLVEVYCEQRALIEIELPDGDELPVFYKQQERLFTPLAMMKLDESGGAEWHTELAYTHLATKSDDMRVVKAAEQYGLDGVVPHMSEVAK